MDLTGEYRIPASRDIVWRALNDPEILKASIPGCQELEKVSDTELNAKVTAKVGPVKSNFDGQVRLEDLNPPESYRIVGQGKGGAAGFAKGGAQVNLSEEGDETVLRYEAQADVGGKLAQIGSRVVKSFAKSQADKFFSNFVAEVSARQGGTAPAAPSEPERAAPAAAPGTAPEPVAADAAGQRPAPARPEEPRPTQPSQAPETKGSTWNKPAIWIGVAVVVLILLYQLLGTE